MKNPDRDFKHRRRRQAGTDEQEADGMEVARTLFGGPQEQATAPPEIVIKDSNLSGFRMRCSLCDKPMETRPGPWIFLDGHSPGYVCKPCGRRVDPETVTELEDRRKRYLEERTS